MKYKDIPISLYGKQAELLNDWLNTDKHCIDICPAGAGKTFLASIALPIFASHEKYHHGKDILYVAPTMAMIQALIWTPLKQSCLENFGLSPNAINNSSMTITFPNGVVIRCKSAEQGFNLRGMNVGIALLDEAAIFGEEALFELSNRLRPRVGQPGTEGRMIVISTPKGNGPLYSMYKTALAYPDEYIVRHYNYIQMRSCDPNFVAKQKILLSPAKFASDYMTSFDNIEDQFFYAWNKDKFCAPVLDRGGDLYTAHDFNKRRMAAIVAQVVNPYKTDGRIEILKTYAINDCSTEGMAQAIRQDFPKRRLNSIIDWSGTQVNRDTTSAFGVTDRTLLEKYGFQIINNKNSNPLIADTDNTSNAFIARGGLIVKPDDNLLQEALSTYHYEDGTRKKLVKYTEQAYAHIDGCGDALRYLIHHLFPIQHADTGIAEYVGMDQRFARLNRPGIEHMPESPLFKGGPTMEEILGGVDEAPDYMVS